MESRPIWIAAGWIVTLLALLFAAWQWTDLHEWTNPDRIASLVEPYRSSWLALPVTILVFVLAELLLFPVLVLVFVCGLAFGPWLGPPYALAGAVASAVVPFLIGRRIGRERLERIGGKLVIKLEKALERRGIVAVFLVRKIPAPYTVINLACGASPLSLRDFVLGTTFGMTAGVVALTVVGANFAELVHDPDPRAIALVVAVIAISLGSVLFLQRALNRRIESRS